MFFRLERKEILNRAGHVLPLGLEFELLGLRRYNRVYTGVRLGYWKIKWKNHYLGFRA